MYTHVQRNYLPPWKVARYSLDIFDLLRFVAVMFLIKLERSKMTCRKLASKLLNMNSSIFCFVLSNK